MLCLDLRQVAGSGRFAAAVAPISPASAPEHSQKQDTDLALLIFSKDLKFLRNVVGHFSHYDLRIIRPHLACGVTALLLPPVRRQHHLHVPGSMSLSKPGACSQVQYALVRGICAEKIQPLFIRQFALVNAKRSNLFWRPQCKSRRRYLDSAHPAS